jgi:hypothetical protein
VKRQFVPLKLSLLRPQDLCDWSANETGRLDPQQKARRLVGPDDFMTLIQEDLGIGSSVE